MSYRYLALVDEELPQEPAAQDTLAILDALGMQERLALGPIRLFAAKGTPTLALPDRSVIIGHLFRRNDGSLVTDCAQIPKSASPTHLREYILENCWGDYILMQPIEADTHGFSVMRDPSGGLPCVYSLSGGTGFITSDVSLATAAGLYAKKIDWDFVSSCLIYPQQRTGRTGLSGIRELMPGCCLSVQHTRTATTLAWSPWNYVSAKNRRADPSEARADIRASVNLAVKALAETDQSVLLELSGGLDSSIVAACLRGAKAHVACGTVVTPVPGADERQYASLMADELGTTLHAEELQFEDARFNFAPPPYLTSPSVIALQYAINSVMEGMANRLGAASYFSGAGGDAIFCYLKTAAPAADAIRDRGLSLGRTSIHDLAELHQCTLWKATRLTLRKLLRAPKPPRKADHSFVVPSKIATDLEAHPWLDAPTDALPGDRERIFDVACSHAFRDGSPRGAKRRVRMPLLSQPVMEACFRAPTWMWFDGGRNRALARSAFEDSLPQKILHRSSKGTFVNYSAAVYRRSMASMRDFLLNGDLQSRGFLDTSALQRFFDSELRPRDQSFMRIFDLAMIENWVRHQP